MAYAIYIFIINKFMAYVNNLANFSFDEAKVIVSPVSLQRVTFSVCTLLLYYSPTAQDPLQKSGSCAVIKVVRL